MVSGLFFPGGWAGGFRLRLLGGLWLTHPMGLSRLRKRRHPPAQPPGKNKPEALKSARGLTWAVIGSYDSTSR